MPTGYTAAVVDGKITDFPQFALHCARAFGALISMRDESSDAPLPIEIKPSTYHADKLPLLRAQLAGLQSMSAEDAATGAERDYAAKVESRARYERERLERNARLNAMLAFVDAWTPPTPDHEQMKSFMREQLCISFENPYAQELVQNMSGENWRADQIAKVQHEIKYHEEEDRKEIARADNRNRWLQALRSSLAPTGVAA